MARVLFGAGYPGANQGRGGKLYDPPPGTAALLGLIVSGSCARRGLPLPDGEQLTVKRFLLPAALAVALLTGLGSAGADDKGRVVPGPTDGIRQFYSGNAFYDLCRKFPHDGVCWSYVAGIADAMSSNEKTTDTISGWSACIPVEVTVPQLVDVVEHFLREHPEARHAPASQLVAGALAQAFECPTATASQKAASP
jgi:hypothetical protein